MKAEEFLTQEMIDKLQQYTDDDNGVIDDVYLEKLLDDYGKSLLNGVMQSSVFKEKLLEAIECGEDTDYLWNGEDEMRVDSFDSQVALDKVLELLTSYFV